MRTLTICLAACTFLGLAACGPGDDDDGVADIDATPIDAPDTTPTCSTYCATVKANCVDGMANRQYFADADCMASCAFMPTGTLADMTGNTLGCRIYHAGAAAADPAMHCTHAGPGGDGACGMNCEGFCQLAVGTCTGSNQAYADLATCMTACAAFPSALRYNTQVQVGNSFACKLYHATAAAANPNLHCAHVKATGAPCQ